jgi:hypothetical protein
LAHEAAGEPLISTIRSKADRRRIWRTHPFDDAGEMIRRIGHAGVERILLELRQHVAAITAMKAHAIIEEAFAHARIP